MTEETRPGFLANYKIIRPGPDPARIRPGPVDISKFDSCAASVRVGATASSAADSDLQLAAADGLRDGNPAHPRESSPPT